MNMNAVADDPIWCFVGGIALHISDREILCDSQQWLNDRHINAAQRLLKLAHPNIIGFSDTLLIANNISVVEGDEQATIQIHNVNNSHWIVSFFDAATNSVTVKIVNINKSY
jgi:hypothetical protein